MKGKFNLSDWALKHQSFVWYLMFVGLLMGVFSYMNLGREEDPSFTIKTMVIQTRWPGATVDETLEQVTDRIEKKLEELDSLDYVKSYTRPGESTVFVYLRDTTDAKAIPDIWYQVRKKIDDIRGTFPQGLQGPAFNDEFGDVYGSIYAFTADGLTLRQLRDYVEQVRVEIRDVPGLGKVEMIGQQDEVLYLNFSTRKLAALGLDQRQVVQSLQSQNTVTPAGVIEAGPERISVRTSGQFASEKDLEAVNLRLNDRFYRLSDIAEISRGYVDPPKPLFRYNGKPAIGLAIAMKKGGNIQEFGKALHTKMEAATADLPVGVGVNNVSDQAEVVEKAVGGFTSALFEAVVIVLIVSFISLGMRAGLVVACSIPLVLAMVFVFMEYSGITMQRISLGALIIALGLLVDDAMITVEMMVTRLEMGDTKEQAATFAYTSTAFPMLTGTLVTVAGFVPIGLNASSAGEYTFTLFAVIAVAMLVSWVVAVLFAPVIGVHILSENVKKKDEHAKPGRIARAFNGSMFWAMRHRWLTIIITILIFAASLFCMRFVQNQFFPSSDRPEILVDLNLPQNASINETRKAVDRLEATLKDDPDIVRWSTYIGQGAVRFYLPLDQQLENPYYAQLVIVSKGLEERGALTERLKQTLRKDFVGIGTYVQALEMGPPVGRPIQYRVSGENIDKVRQHAIDLATLLDQNQHIGEMIYDWNEPGKVLRIDINQDKARQLGLSSEDVAQLMNSIVTGSAVTQVRDDIYLINVVGRAEDAERGSPETLQNLQIVTPSGTSIPLLAFATVRYELEQPLVWRRDRKPTITLKAAVRDDMQPTDLVKELKPEIDKFAAALPTGYKVATGGTVEESGKAQGPIAKVVPLMIFLMATFLMIQLHSVQKMFLVASVAPLGLIGVVLALVPTGTPMGFVAILGILALIGIIIRNSVILVTQIDAYEKSGYLPWDAVAEATEHRRRPILLTAAAASLGMIPIAREVFWGPMAYAMIGGIIIATLLTLLFLPALYVAWYKIREPSDEDRSKVEAKKKDKAQTSDDQQSGRDEDEGEPAPAR
jgi:multidrug efflux pump subunit AcrB